YVIKIPAVRQRHQVEGAEIIDIVLAGWPKHIELVVAGDCADAEVDAAWIFVELFEDLLGRIVLGPGFDHPDFVIGGQLSDRSEIVDRHVSGAGDVRQEDSIRLDDNRSTVVLPLQNGRASRVSTASAHVLDTHKGIDVGVFEPVFGDAGREVEPSTGRAGCDGCYSRRRETF